MAIRRYQKSLLAFWKYNSGIWCCASWSFSRHRNHVSVWAVTLLSIRVPHACVDRIWYHWCKGLYLHMSGMEYQNRRLRVDCLFSNLIMSITENLTSNWPIVRGINRSSVDSNKKGPAIRSMSKSRGKGIGHAKLMPTPYRSSCGIW